MMFIFGVLEVGTCFNGRELGIEGKTAIENVAKLLGVSIEALNK